MALACAFVLVSATGLAATSIWAARVGKILPTDQTAWCTTGATSMNGKYTVTANLQEVNTDGSLVQAVYTDSSTISVRMQCWDSTKNTFSIPSQSGFVNSNAVVQCPAGLLGVYVKCMINSTDGTPFVYDGNQGGDPCGDGATGATVSSGNGYMGQVTGQSAVMEYSPPGNTLYNNTPSTYVMANAQVLGTDMGYMFYGSGKLWAGYGDTWANSTWLPVAPTNSRGSVLFNTSALNPASGLQFGSWVGAPSFATEIVPSCHKTTPCSLKPNEQSAIADAGFELYDPVTKTSYRVLWFLSINTWGSSTALNTSTFNGSSVAWSANGGPFTRGDLQSAPNGTTPPRWGPTSSFGAGAIWFDRLNGWIYFFGQEPYQNDAPIVLARVPASINSVLDGRQYTYWDATHTTWSSSESAATPIIPGSANAGPEFSVAFDAYANRFFMMFVNDRWNVQGTANVQLWQSTILTAGWSQVPNATVLPNGNMNGSLYAGKYWFFYGPEMSEQLMTGGGQTVYYQLSEWNGASPLLGYPGGLPYNTGLWNYNVSRSTVSTCAE